MTIKSHIERRLTEAFAPDLLDVVDESEKHRGHGGWREGGETHFRVRIVSATFDDMNRVARHRAVNACLKDALAQGVHALAIEARAPGEPDPRGGGRATAPA
ncbi:BolA family transcriptional regulator [Stappia sp. ES.058]|uniref:BolA family protein n=1 Tax=Stappia sp. ES.058 TaxID=1881061 RepID=UPI00087A52FD|nr:BolA family protein [Stappia sp. ES.058]SDU40106.1 transcriptional regulator, BolA protein family [Stappia sp. ES.058]